MKTSALLILLIFALAGVLSLALSQESVDQPPTSAVTDTSPDKMSIDASWQLFEHGRKLTDEEASAYQAKLQKDPTDLEARLQLLGHVPRRDALPPEGVKLLLGVIENNPRSNIAGPICIATSAFDSPTYKQAFALWQKQINANPDDGKIIGNAAIWMSNYAMIHPEYLGKSKNLLEKARTLDPDNSNWAESLGHVWLAEARAKSANQAEKRVAAKKGIEQFESSYQLRNGKDRATHRMLDGQSYVALLADASLLAGDSAKAKEYALEVLKTANVEIDGWRNGNMIYQYNCVLGRIALHEGKPDEAAQYLLAAGKTPGSPQLNTFGPEFSLAKELLQAGKKDEVLQFLDLVGNFWGNTDQDAEEKNTNTRSVNEGNVVTLEKYRQEIRDGKIPSDRKWQTEAPEEGGLTEESIRPFLTMVNKLEERGKFDEWRKHVAKDATFAYYRGPGKIGRHEMTVEEYWESMKDSDERTTVVSSEFVPNTITVMDDGRKAAVKATQVFVMRNVATKRVVRSESESDLVIRIHDGAPVIASSESTQLKLTLEPDQLSKQIRSTFSEQGEIDPKQAAAWVEEIGGRYFGGETQKLDMSFTLGENTPYGDEVLILASQLPDLKVIGVDSPYISDEGLTYIVGLKHLESLWLQCAGVTDEGLKTVSKVESLKMLVLMGSGVTDSGLPHLEKHKGLEMLGVSDTGVSEEGVKKLQEKRPDLKILHENTIDQPAE